MSTACWHCGDPLPSRGTREAAVAGAMRAFCCSGCLAAAQWIEQLGLADYYRLRTGAAGAPATVHGRTDIAAHDLSAYKVHAASDGQQEVALFLEGIRCSACVWLIERVLLGLPGMVCVHIEVLSQRARLVWDGQQLSLDRILTSLDQIGYRGMPLASNAPHTAQRRERRDALKRIGVAGLGSMQAMMFAAALYIGDFQQMDVATRDWFRWLGLLVSTPVVFYSAQPFFRGAWRSLRSRRLGMDVPVAIAVALAYIATLLATLQHADEVYLDSASMFVFFLLTGRYLEMRARHQANDTVSALTQRAPLSAERVLSDGRTESVPANTLQPGDLIHVTEGGIVAADGTLESARCLVDENLLHGESLPRPRTRGDRLLAGSVLIDGPVRLRVEQCGESTVLAGILSLMERARLDRPKIARAGERLSSHLILAVLLMAALTAMFWAFADPHRVFGATMAVLVVACPCAFALAVPAAFARALAAAAHRGMLILRLDAVPALADATHAIFDKTGTLTEPQALSAQAVTVFGEITADQAVQWASALAQQSRHPLARVMAAAPTRHHATDVETVPGLGIRGLVEGRALRLGQEGFAGPADSDIRNGLWLSDENGALAHFALSERLRDGAERSVRALQDSGLAIEILSGDSAARVAAIAQQLDVPRWRARQRPQDKLQRLQELRAEGARPIAVGDGINDAPVLAGAHVGIAMASGADIAMTASDIVLTDGSIRHLPWLRQLAQQTLAILHQNQRWALFYNLAAIPLAAIGWMPPWLAALGMSASSLFVMLNASRIGAAPADTRVTAPLESTRLRTS